MGGFGSTGGRESAASALMGCGWGDPQATRPAGCRIPAPPPASGHGPVYLGFFGKRNNSDDSDSCQAGTDEGSGSSHVRRSGTPEAWGPSP